MILCSVIPFLAIINERKRIIAIICLVFFPLMIQFMDKDAFTVSTALIYIFAPISILRRVHDFTRFKINLLVIIIMIFAVLSTLNVPMTPSMIGPAVRKLSDFISSMLLLLCISNMNFSDHTEGLAFAEKLISVILIMAFGQFIISVVLYMVPDAREFFGYFTLGKEEIMQGFVMVQGHARLYSPAMAYEALGEFIALSSPLVLYKFYSKRNIIWLIGYFFMFAVLALNQTRSGMILFVVSSLIFLAFNLSKLNIKTTLSGLFISIFAIVLSIENFNILFSGVITRLQESQNILNKGSNIFATINREGFYYNMGVLIDNINAFGHGLLSPIAYKLIEYHFHNLIQTILFQFGYIGAPFYFILLFSIFFNTLKSWRISNNKNMKFLLFSLFVAMMTFLVNEMKYEFNRYEAYQQIIWALFGTFLLITRHIYDYNSAEHSGDFRN